MTCTGEPLGFKVATGVDCDWCIEHECPAKGQPLAELERCPHWRKADAKNPGDVESAYHQVEEALAKHKLTPAERLEVAMLVAEHAGRRKST